MRICLYTSTALPKVGGQEVVVDALAREYQAAGHDVVVLAPMPRRPLRPEDAALPYRVVRHPRIFSKRFFVGLHRWWLRRLFRSFRFDVLHVQGVYPTGYLAALCRRRLPVPIVLTSQGDDVHERGRRGRSSPLRPRLIEAVQAADALTAISSFTRDGYLALGAPPEKIVTIPNGVDVEAMRAVAPRPPDLDPAIRPGEYLLFLGRLVRRKGVDVLLDALAGLPAGQLVVTGDGDERAALEAQARPLGGRVHFVGGRYGSEKAYLLQNARCLVVPSRDWESFGVVLVEAAAAGTPVIASALQGMREVVEDNQLGRVVPPEDVLALRQALAEVVAPSPAERDRLRRAAGRYHWRSLAAEHLALFEELRQRSPLTAAPSKAKW